MAKQRNYVITEATLSCPGHKLHGKKVTLEVSEGKITKLSSFHGEDKKEDTIDGKGKILTPGFVDLIGNFCDPGMEHREDFLTGAKAAIYGGYTHVGVNPFNHPVTDSKSGISYVNGANQNSPINLIPLGTLSMKGTNSDIPEIQDMVANGAQGFYSGKQQLSERLLLTGIEYCQGINALPMIFPVMDSLAMGGQINESVISSQTGLKAIPAIAETMALSNILKLAKYASARVHISHISCAESVNLISEAKKDGVKVTCSVASHQLLFTDESCMAYDTRFKVYPPFRTENDRKALVEACKSGVIDAIISDHSPVDIEAKKTEFDHAEFGIINFQTAFGSVLAKGELGVDQLVNLMAINPGKILDLKSNGFDLNEIANFNLIVPSISTGFSVKDIKSKSFNSPFINRELKGAISHTACKGELHIKS